MQQEQTITTPVQPITLAYVEDSHNLGCMVRYVGETARRRAHFSHAIQEHGVVIRTGHVVVVDATSDPVEVTWRAGTLGTVEAVSGEAVTINLGYRLLTLPLRDERPEAERAHPVVAGDRVLLRGSPVEQAAITDLLVGGELAHPERLRATIERRLSERASQANAQAQSQP